MMIYINARFLTQDITGVQRFAIELSKKLVSLRNDIIFLVPDLKSIVDTTILDIFFVKEIKGGEGYFWEQITLPRYLSKINSPLLINLCNTAPVFYKNKISTIHDVTFLHYPKSYSVRFRVAYRFLIPMIIKTSEKIITVSEFSKNDICQEYKLNPEKIIVIYNAVASNFKELKNIENDKKYALAVSSPNLHKNFKKMIDAFLTTEINLDLKIIGSLSNSFNQQSKVEIDKRIQFLGRVNDQELVKLYQNADFFIFPSLYEGFGIPPLEAQACGCPVVCSNAASLPEIMSDSALFFDPKSVNSIQLALKKISEDHLLKTRLISKGFENLTRFSWHTSALKLNKVIDHVLSKAI